MKIRVLRLESGTEIEESDFNSFVIHSDGTVTEIIDGMGYEIGEPYIVEVAFRKDEENQWVWEHSVIHE